MLILPITFLRPAFKRRKLRHREIKSFPTSRGGLELCCVWYRLCPFSSTLTLSSSAILAASSLSSAGDTPLTATNAGVLLNRHPPTHIHPFTRCHKRMTSNSSLSSCQCLPSLRAALSFHLHKQPLLGVLFLRAALFSAPSPPSSSSS